MKSILDPSFRYTKSVDTDIRKTFARIRRELRLQDPPPAEPEPRPSNVKQLKKKEA
jgi:hypothetical protein